MRRTERILKWACLAILIIWLAGCSLARLGYSNGETITYWWLNGYVGFDDVQQRWVRGRIDKLFVWHRKTQLKDYVSFLTAAQLRLKRGATKATVLEDYEGLTNRVDTIIDKAAPDLADLALSMTDENLQKLKEKFAANNDKFRDEYLRGDREEQQEHRFRQIMEWAEYWFGDFSDEQEAAIRLESDKRPLNNEMWLADRMERQKALIAMIKHIQTEKPSRDAVIDMIKTYVVNHYLVRTDADPEMKTFFATSKESVAQLAAVIINLTTPRQKARAHDKLQQWIDDFESLQGNK